MDPPRAGYLIFWIQAVNRFKWLDFRVDRQFELGTARIIPSIDVFNVTNGNSVLARRRNQNATNANNVSGIVAPRVIRFGVRVTF